MRRVHPLPPRVPGRRPSPTLPHLVGHWAQAQAYICCQALMSSSRNLPSNPGVHATTIRPLGSSTSSPQKEQFFATSSAYSTSLLSSIHGIHLGGKTLADSASTYAIPAFVEISSRANHLSRRSSRVTATAVLNDTPLYVPRSPWNIDPHFPMGFWKRWIHLSVWLTHVRRRSPLIRGGGFRTNNPAHLVCVGKFYKRTDSACHNHCPYWCNSWPLGIQDIAKIYRTAYP